MFITILAKNSPEQNIAVKEAYENEPGPVDDAAKLLQDMVAVGSHIGLDPMSPNF